MITYYTLDCTDSTNNWAKRHAHFFQDGELAVITAHEQTAGRGRFARSWHSPRGQNLYLSYAFCIPKMPSYAFCYSQMAALAIYDTLRTRNMAAVIKWPNDILIEGKKIAGILTETHALDERYLIIVGIGLNVNMPPDALVRIDKPATSMAVVSGTSWDIAELQEGLTQAFTHHLHRSLADTMTSWHALVSWMVGTTTRVRQQDSLFDGVVRCIEADGSLVLQTSNGDALVLRSGEVV